MIDYFLAGIQGTLTTFSILIALTALSLVVIGFFAWVWLLTGISPLVLIALVFGQW